MRGVPWGLVKAGLCGAFGLYGGKEKNQNGHKCLLGI